MKQNNQHINRYRVRGGPYGSSNRAGNNGAFRIPGPGQVALWIIASDGLGWEHVSVSVVNEERCPTWDEMCHVKNLFWHEEEVVIQYHPAKSQYVKCHPYALHLWKPQGIDLPTPPPILVGPVGTEVIP